VRFAREELECNFLRRCRSQVVESRLTRMLLRLGTAATLAFIYIPLIVVILYAFNRNVTQKWPIEEYSTKWFSVAFHNADVREALKVSLLAALGATAIALVLGTLAAMAVSRYRFFGREVITFAVILPIALPGIVTGLALQATIVDVLGPIGVSFGLATIIVGHATFCVVVVYNNAIARLRRTAGSLDEASADLGADSFQTFRYVMFPQLRSALLAGALLSFALSFDEVVVTIFTSGAQQTLPIWIFAALARPAELPIVNVVALAVIVLSLIPVWLAQRIAGGVDGARGGGRT
jgi:putative spermidine/putrescine transport system permease protein